LIQNKNCDSIFIYKLGYSSQSQKFNSTVESRRGRSSDDAFDNVFTRLGAEQWLLSTNTFEQPAYTSPGFRRVEPFSGVAGFYGGVETQPGNASLYQTNTRLNSGLSIAPSSFGRDRAFGAAQPFSGESRFYGGVDMRRGRDSDYANNNLFTRHAAELRKKRHISDNSSINKFYEGFGDDTITKRHGACYSSNKMNRLQ